MSDQPVVVTLNCKYGSVEIRRHGAHVTSWKSTTIQNGTQELLYVSPMAILDTPGKAIRGGVPVCWPQFSDQGPYGVVHGWARSSAWTVVGQQAEEESASATFQLPPETAEGRGEKVDAALFSNVLVLYTVTLSQQGLSMKLDVENGNKDADVPFTSALHTYFGVPTGIQNLTIDSDGPMDSVSWHNNLTKSIVPAGQECPTVIDQEVDRIYFGVQDKPSSFTYPASQDSQGGGERVRITVRGGGGATSGEFTGFEDAVLWNPWIAKAKTLKDLPDDGYEKFLCIESARIQNPVVLKPGAKWSGTALLSATPVLVSKA